jgi:uncharacterized protein (TIGR02246 family)
MPVTALRALVDRYLEAFNAGDLDAWTELFDEDVEVTGDGGTMRGREATRAFTARTMSRYPGIRAELVRVVAETAERIVVEYRLVNPEKQTSGWRLDGTVCAVYEVRDGRIAACRNYYLPGQSDRTDAAQLPDRVEAARIAEERAALHRVAALVAQGVSDDWLFAAVNDEVAQLVGADATAMLRFEPDDTVTLAAAWSAIEGPLPIGERRPVDDALRSLRADPRPLRFEPGELPVTGPFIEEAQQRGISTSVGVPILVDGRVWGVSFAAATGEKSFEGDTEARIAGFTKLVATAIANAQARAELQMLVEEQRALRRVTMLVAHGASQAEVFDAVAREASRIIGREPTALLRYDPDVMATTVAVRGGLPLQLGTRSPTDGDTISGRILRSGRPARIDSYPDHGGPAAVLAHDVGMRAAVGAPIFVSGRIWGFILAMSADDPLPVGTEDRLSQFAELVGTAIGNAENHAELRASRARVVAAADESRRRIQRDLHDGAQQRLVHTLITLKQLKRELAAAGGPEADLVDEALEHAAQATAGLRELVHGIMPAALAHGGLRAGVHSIVDSMDLPVRVEVLSDRLPAPVETTAFFIVAEALTNIVKHACAESASVRAECRDGALELEVSDDGVGGADRSRGTGLVGLTDRVAAGGGRIVITSPPGAGTTLAVTLPIRRGGVRGSMRLPAMAAVA